MIAYMKTKIHLKGLHSNCSFAYIFKFKVAENYLSCYVQILCWKEFCLNNSRTYMMKLLATENVYKEMFELHAHLHHQGKGYINIAKLGFKSLASEGIHYSNTSLTILLTRAK